MEICAFHSTFDGLYKKYNLKAKEFSNGSLEEKPNATASEENIIITEDKDEE